MVSIDIYRQASKGNKLSTRHKTRPRKYIQRKERNNEKIDRCPFRIIKALPSCLEDRRGFREGKGGGRGVKSTATKGWMKICSRFVERRTSPPFSVASFKPSTSAGGDDALSDGEWRWRNRKAVMYIYIPMWEKGANGRRQRKDLNYERRKGLAIFEEKKEAKEKNK